MTEGTFYGIWNGKKNYWVDLSKNLGLFAGGDVGLRIVRGTFHNIRHNLGKGWDNVDYQICCLGEDGLPTGEPLVTSQTRKTGEISNAEVMIITEDTTKQPVAREEAEHCRSCCSVRIASVSGRCKDACWVKVGDRTDMSYPPGWNISAGDDISFRYCLDCGQVQGQFPVELTHLEEGWVVVCDREWTDG